MIITISQATAIFGAGICLVIAIVLIAINLFKNKGGLTKVNELPEKFGGDCMLLQQHLRRLAELKGDKVEELSQGHIRCEVDNDIFLTLYGNPQSFGNSPLKFYGDIYYPKRRFCRREYINEHCAQVLYEELNIAIKEKENKED